MSESQRLMIRIKKTADGRSSLSCTRPDGSATWQSMKNAQAAFFPRHDLTHYAVETVLGHRRGFYGLVADGWDLSHFGTPWPRGPIPADADPSELIVGFLDAERACREQWSAADLNEKGAQYFAARGIRGVLQVSDEQLARVRARMHELFGQWEAV